MLLPYATIITSALSHSLITKEVFVLSVLGKGLSIDEKRLIIETEPKSFFRSVSDKHCCPVKNQFIGR